MVKEFKRDLKREKRLKAQFHRLTDKTGFAFELSAELESKGLIGSTRTILTHWFSDARLSGNMPTDKERLTIIEAVLKASPKVK